MLVECRIFSGFFLRNFRPFVPIEHLFGTFFAQSRAQLGAAIARGMALRAFGTSSMGLSKVFLRWLLSFLCLALIRGQGDRLT